MSKRRSWSVTPARSATLARSLLVCVGLCVSLSVGACASEGDSVEDTTELDTRLVHHAVDRGAVTAQGLHYVQAVADAHRQADRSSSEDDALAILLAAAQRTPPTGDGTAELLHYELLARSGELLLGRQDSEGALSLLEPHLDPARSLPVDRASARCLVALGDAAALTGDLNLAMGSYARALDMLTLLIEEVEP